MLSIVAAPVLVLLIPIFDTTLVTMSRMVSGRPRRRAAAIIRRTGWSRSGCRSARRSTLLWLLAAAGGAIGVAFRYFSGVVVARRRAVRRRHDVFAVYLGGIRVYETSDAAALERGGLTPIVVDFVYKRRVAEVLLDFVLVTVSYYAAYRLKFDFIEFAANFTYFTRSLPVVVAVQLVAFFVVGVYQGVWRHFSATDAVTSFAARCVGTIALRADLRCTCSATIRRRRNRELFAHRAHHLRSSWC